MPWREYTPTRPQYIQPLYVCFTSFSLDQPIPIEDHELPLIDCSVLRPPRLELCDRFTGLDLEIDRDFFSAEPETGEKSESTVVFERTRRCLRRIFSSWSFPAEGHFFLVPIACTAGVHRSLAMAERLAWDVSRWEFRNCRLRVSVEHIELWRRVVGDKNRSRETQERYGRLLGQARNNIGDDGIIMRRYRQGRVISVRNVDSEEDYDDD